MNSNPTVSPWAEMPPTPFTRRSFIAIISIFIIVRHVWKFTDSLYFSLLARIPGPKVGCIHEIFGYRLTEIPFEALHAMHQVYGSVVRIGPNEVSVVSPADIQKIYGVDTRLEKAPIYDLFRSPGISGPMFAMRDEHIHRSRRRLLNPAYSRSSVMALRPWVFKQCEMLCDQLASEAANSLQGVDIVRYFRMFAGDTSLKMAFNIDGNMVKDASIHPIMEQIKIEMGIPFYILKYARRLRPYMPSWILDRLPTTFRTQLFSLSTIDKLAEGYLRQYLQQVDQGTAENREVMSWIINAKNQAASEKISMAELAAEARSLILAGSDTTAITLSYAIWLITQSASVCSKLRAEISTVMPEPTTLPDDLSELENLPYLTACIYETMRLFPAIPGPFPRVVPKGGLEVGGYVLPAGTIVGANAYAVQRTQPEIWGDDPEMFHPERWVDPRADISSMRKAFFAFSIGTRSCIGRNIAMMQIYAMIAAFVSRFDGAIISPSDNMRPAGTFNIAVKGGECLIQLTKATN